MVLPKKKWQTLLFIFEHRFYLKSSITFVSATKIYQLYTLILGQVVFNGLFPL